MTTFRDIQNLRLKQSGSTSNIGNINLSNYFQEHNEYDGLMDTYEQVCGLSYINRDSQGNYKCFYSLTYSSDGISNIKFPSSVTDLASQISFNEWIDLQQGDVFIPLKSLSWQDLQIVVTMKSHVTPDMIPRELSFSTDCYYFNNEFRLKLSNGYIFDSDIAYLNSCIKQLYTCRGVMKAIVNRLPKSDEYSFVKRHQFIPMGEYYIPRNINNSGFQGVIYNFSAKLLDNEGKVSDKITKTLLNDNLYLSIGQQLIFSFEEFQSDNALPFGRIIHPDVNIKVRAQLNDLIRQGYSLVIEYDEGVIYQEFRLYSKFECDKFIIDSEHRDIYSMKE